jgi:DNA helicase-2/ATP-dependent DNA helicase PcrA
MPVDPPARLGRGVIVAAGSEAPEPWRAAERVTVDDDVLRDPAKVVEHLHDLWSRRDPFVIELATDADALRAPQTDARPPYALTPSFEFAREHLYFLARSNNYDARRGPLVWGPTLEAARLGAKASRVADVVLPDGSDAWIDGGPRTDEVLRNGEVIVHRARLDQGELTPDRQTAVVATLAPDQLAAVTHPGGPARIIAPAGSGKTRVLTERFRALVAGRRWEPASVCAVAYNVRAKAEMEHRLRDLGWASLRKVRTLHALGFDILRRSRGDHVVLSEGDVRRRVESLVPVRPRANTDVYAPYLEALAEVRLGLASPQAVEAQRDDVEGFAAMFDEFRTRLRADRAVDHDEQIYGALEVLLTDVDVRHEFQRECRHLLVDEFQDLTPAQLLMLRLVAAPAYDVFGVGDDDQVIYGYAGADPAFLVDYNAYFPGAAHLQLEVNYRCPADVVRAATNLLSHNHLRVPKAIRAANAEHSEPAVSIRTVAAEELPAAAFAQVQRRLADGAEPRAIAVLSRVRASLLAVQLACREAGVPATTPIGPWVLDRTGMRTALAYLRLASTHAEGLLAGSDVAAAARRPSRGLRRETLETIGRRREWRLADLGRLASEASGRLDEFLADVAALAARVRAGATTAELLRFVRDTIGLGAALDTLDRGGRGPEASHRDDLNALIAVAQHGRDLFEFEPWLRAALADQVAESDDQVTLSTVHRVKGMEWAHVVVLGAHDGLMPHHLADDIEEERRIFHVALTRTSVTVDLVVERGVRTPFVDEMSQMATRRNADERRPVGIAGATVTRSKQSKPAGHLAVTGLVLTFAGSTGPVIEVRTESAIIAADDGGHIVVPYGERVDVDGRRAPLIGPEPRSQTEPDEALFGALKAWRRDRARADGVPAYVILHDSHLREIAGTRPRTLEALARCPGIGPTKLERYGDEIVAVVSDFSS